MTNVDQRCKATTQSGDRCKNYATVGDEYCHMHGGRTSVQRATGASSDMQLAPGVTTSEKHSMRSTRPTSHDPDVDLLMQELDGLIRELRSQIPDIDLDEIGPAHIVHLFNSAIGRRLPSTPAALFEDIEHNLSDSSFADFADPDTLRGMALLTYYSVQAQTNSVREPVVERLRDLPGYSVLSELKSNLSGATIDDVLDPDTWKGMWTIASYTAQLKLQELLQDGKDTT